MPKKTLRATAQDNIIAMLGLQSVSAEKKIRIIEEATKLVEKRVMVRFLQTLSDADVPEMEKVAQDQEKFFAFIFQKMPNIEQITQEEALKVKQELAALGEK